MELFSKYFIMLDIKQLGERLKSAREKLNVNPRQFSLKAKVDPSQYNKTEAGNKGLGPKKIMDICSTWKINRDWLFTGKGEMFTEQDLIKKGDFNIETAHLELISYLKDLKTGQQNIWNQGQVVRQEVAGVADYLMLKDAEWDPEKMKELKETYYKIVRGAPPEASPVNKLKGNHKKGKV